MRISEEIRSINSSPATTSNFSGHLFSDYLLKTVLGVIISLLPKFDYTEQQNLITLLLETVDTTTVLTGWLKSITNRFVDTLRRWLRSQVAKAADCKSAIVGSTPTGASSIKPTFWQRKRGFFSFFGEAACWQRLTHTNGHWGGKCLIGVNTHADMTLSRAFIV